MTNRLKIFLISFLVSLPIWLGIDFSQKKLENFFFSELYIETPRIFAAQLVGQPKLSVSPELFDIQAKAALSLKISGEGPWEILYQKNIKEKLPIASLTKLMTALVVLENYDLSLPIEISKEAVDQEENSGQLKIGETLTAKNLLYIMLVESSNDAAYALAETIGVESFVDIMNWKARDLGLKNTHFVNPTGLDGLENYSSAQDLAVFTRTLLKQPLLWEILGTSEYALYLPNGVFHHQLKNTNELLNEFPRIIGGKTGWSPEAGGCLISVLKNSQGEYLINIILGAADRFAEMKKIINYLQ